MVVANDTVSVKVIKKKSINIVTVYTMMVWGTPTTVLPTSAYYHALPRTLVLPPLLRPRAGRVRKVQPMWAGPMLSIDGWGIKNVLVLVA